MKTLMQWTKLKHSILRIHIFRSKTIHFVVPSTCKIPFVQNSHREKLPRRTPREKRKRRRIISPTQRVAANLRERRRMVNLNDAYDGLRTLLPTFTHEKNLSRVHTLKLAVDYISFMKDMLTAESSSQSASEEEKLLRCSRFRFGENPKS